MLMAECDEPENAAQRQQLLGETRKVCELGLKLPGFTGERARLRRGLGTCLVLLAQSATEEAAKRGLYQEAIRQFASAGQVASVAGTPRLYTHWGVALLEYGKLTNDRQVLWQAVERLLTALEDDPHNLEARYNLVCVYALMNEPDKAMRNLRICLENDDAGRTYYQAAARDPDLNSLRRTPAYNEIFGEKPSSSADSLNKPTISDQ
jgi:tetratricopeptide (TPR) repeat protein